MKPKLKVFINEKELEVKKGSTIFDASNKVLIKSNRIPTLCHHPYLKTTGNCRICLVEMKYPLKKKNEKGGFAYDDKPYSMVSACNTHLTVPGTRILTNTKRVNHNIKEVLKMLLSRHPLDCANCDVNGECRFQDYLGKWNISPPDLNDIQKKIYIKETEKFLNDHGNQKALSGNSSIKLDLSKCIKCTRCIRVCSDIQKLDVIGMKGRGKNEKISVFNDMEDFKLTNCIECGQCTFVCPVAAITFNSHFHEVSSILKNPNGKILIASTAPSVRVTLSEEFNMRPGKLTEGQMVAGLKKLGFNYVFDTVFAADLTIMEESQELIKRIETGGSLPIITSCCPGWVLMCEKKYPKQLPYLSTCKSPQGMMGALIKTYWAKKMGVSRDKIISVSIMPCTAKKQESKKLDDIDYVLTTRELGRLIKLHGVRISSLKEQQFDDPLGSHSGAGVIFGSTGGVMEAALRTAHELITGKELPKLNYTQVRGIKGIKLARIPLPKETLLKVHPSIKLKDGNLVVCVAHEGKNIQKVMKRVFQDGNPDGIVFIEFMACPSGCIGGGGNSKLSENKVKMKDFLMGRMKSIYSLDERNTIRKSHENESVKKLYSEFLTKKLAHELLHTTYKDRSSEMTRVGHNKDVSY